MNIVRVDGRFSLKDKLGAGSYATVYRAVDIFNDQELAVKLEPCTPYKSSLEHEFQVLKKLQGGTGFPEPIWFGRELSYYALVLRKIGTSVHHFLVSQGGKLSIGEVLALGVQMVSRLEHVHSRNYIHRDVTPQNMLVEAGSSLNNIFLIDFGVAKEYRDPATRIHIPFCQGCAFVGTLPFASMNQHLGYESARRDDIESLAYVLIFLLNGSLPWFTVANSSLPGDEILRLKQDTPVDNLRIPQEFSTFLLYARSLTSFSSRPDYNYLRTLLQNCRVHAPIATNLLNRNKEQLRRAVKHTEAPKQVERPRRTSKIRRSKR